jgi:hypothetical protein
MTSQWDPGNYRPLDMSKIPGYPRKMPLSYKKWLPRFFGLDGESPDYHMSKFWEFFQYYPVKDEAEDLVMKLFSASLHGEAKKWYDNFPAASITSMDHFKEIFLGRWALKLEDVQSLLKELEAIKQTNYENAKVFEFKFQKLFYQIPESHRPKGKYLVYLYTNGLQGHLSFLLNKRNLKTLAEAQNMAIQIERNLISSGINAITMDALSLIKLVSHETFVEDTQERKEQVFTNKMRTRLRSKNLSKMMKYRPVLLPLMKLSKNLFLLYNKVKMRLVAFHFKMPMTPCIQKMKKKRKLRTKLMALVVQSKIKKQSMRMKQ